MTGEGIFEDGAAELGEAQAALLKAEERQAFLLKLSDALRPIGDAHALRRTACRMLAADLGADRTYYLEYQRELERGVVADDYAAPGLPSLTGQYPLEAFRTTYDQIAGGETWVVGDAAEESRIAEPERKYYAERDIVAWINVPLLKDGGIQAIFCVVHTRSRNWSPEEVQRTEEVAERLWAAVERARAEEALRESEERFRRFAESSSDLLWIYDPARKRHEFLSPGFEALFGFPQNDLLNDFDRFRRAIHSDDQNRVQQAMPRTMGGESVVEEYRIVRPDGTVRWLRDSGFPILDRDGGVQRVGGITRDITEERLRQEALQESEQRARLLLTELQHRVRNLLAMVRSIARQSTEQYEDVDDYVGHLVGRLDAMARTQVSLTRAAGAKVDLEQLIWDELMRLTSDDKVTVEGPEAKLSSKAAEILTLAIHELATNSIKYGALGRNERVAVRWFTTNREDGPWLELMWGEERSEKSAEPVRRGFGTELIEHRIPYELKGEGSISVGPGGVFAEIAFPLTEGASIFETGSGRGMGHDQRGPSGQQNSNSRG